MSESLPLPVSRELRRRSSAPRDLPPAREAVTLPLLLITVAALGGVRVAANGVLGFAPPSLVALVLSILLMAALVSSGALGPDRLCGTHRAPLENASGVVVLIALLVATAQVFTLLTPPRACSRSSSLLSFCCCSGTRWRSGPIGVSCCEASPSSSEARSC